MQNSLLSIDEQQKKELMKNYDDVPLRKPLPAPGPVSGVTSQEVQERPETGNATKVTNSRTDQRAGTACESHVAGRNSSKTVTEIDFESGNESGVTSPTTEFPKVAVKGKPVEIPMVPELKKPEVSVVPEMKRQEVRKQPENKTENVRQYPATSSVLVQRTDAGKTVDSVAKPFNPEKARNSKQNQAAAPSKEACVRKQEDLVLRKTLLQEIKNFSKDIEIKLQNKNKQKDTERFKKDTDYEHKKKIEELRRKDLQDYPYEDVDVQTSLDGKKEMKSKKDGSKTTTRKSGNGNRYGVSCLF